MLCFARETLRSRGPALALVTAAFLVAPALWGAASAHAASGRINQAESYYLAVLGLCYRAGAGMFGEAAADQKNLAVPIAIRRAVSRDWDDAVRQGPQSVTAFCAHSYYSAIGKGYLQVR